MLNYFEENKLNRHTDDTFDGNLTVKKNITIEGNIKSHDDTITVEADLEATGEITDGHGNLLNDVNSAAKQWSLEYQDPQQDEPTVRAKYVLKDYRGVPKGSVIKIYKDSAITNVYLGTIEDTCNPDTGEVTKNPIHDNNEALSIVYRLDTGKYSLVNVPIKMFTTEAEFDKYRGLGVTSNGQVFIKLASDVESSNYLHFNELGEITADGIETRILRDLGDIITSVVGDDTMWGVYKEHEGTQETSTPNDGSRWGEFKRAEEIREEVSNSAYQVFADNWDAQDDDPELPQDKDIADEASYAYNWKSTDGTKQGNLGDLVEGFNNLSTEVSKLEKKVIYDVTTNNNGVTFASLSALLSDENLSTLIPVSVRCGGMSIRFVQSSDNRYVQYRLMSDTFNTTVDNWQGVDYEPTVGSQNLITSGAVEKILKSNNLTNVLLGKCNLVEIKNAYINVVGNIIYHLTSKSVFFDITGINKIIVSVNDNEIGAKHYCAFYDDNYNLVLNNQPLNLNSFTVLEVPTGATRFGALVVFSENGNLYSTCCFNFDSGITGKDLYKISSLNSIVFDTTPKLKFINGSWVDDSGIHSYPGSYMSEPFDAKKGTIIKITSKTLRNGDSELEEVPVIVEYFSETNSYKALLYGNHTIRERTLILDHNATLIVVGYELNELRSFEFSKSLSLIQLLNLMESESIKQNETYSPKIEIIEGKYLKSDGTIGIYKGSFYTSKIDLRPGDIITGTIQPFLGYDYYIFGYTYNEENEKYIPYPLLSVPAVGENEANVKNYTIEISEPVSIYITGYHSYNFKISIQNKSFVECLEKFKINILDDINNNKKWIDKKWICIGDSLTEKNFRSLLNYYDYIKEETGITIINKGQSGTGYKETYLNGSAFYQRIGNLPTDVNVITIFGSGNDLHRQNGQQKYQLGEPTDSGSDVNPTTICGCINKTLDVIQTNYPLIPLGIITPTPWWAQDYDYSPNIENNAMELYVEALIEIAKMRSIPLLDLYHCSNLHPSSQAFRELCFKKDGDFQAATSSTSGAIQVTEYLLPAVRAYLPSAEIGDWVIQIQAGVHPDENGHKLISARFKWFLESLLN